MYCTCQDLPPPPGPLPPPSSPSSTPPPPPTPPTLPPGHEHTYLQPPPPPPPSFQDCAKEKLKSPLFWPCPRGQEIIAQASVFLFLFGCSVIAFGANGRLRCPAVLGHAQSLLGDPSFNRNAAEHSAKWSENITLTGSTGPWTTSALCTWKMDWVRGALGIAGKLGYHLLFYVFVFVV